MYKNITDREILKPTKALSERAWFLVFGFGRNSLWCFLVSNRPLTNAPNNKMLANNNNNSLNACVLQSRQNLLSMIMQEQSGRT